MFGVLEFGVDGVILSTNSLDEVNKSMQYLELKMFPIKLAKIVYVKDVGSGERVCVDTTSILKTGEGMLVGSQSNFMFLIHNESVDSCIHFAKAFSSKCRSHTLLYNYLRWQHEISLRNRSRHRNNDSEQERSF